MEEHGGQGACSQKGEAKLNARSGESDSIVQANILISEGCLYNDPFKAYKTHLQVPWSKHRKVDVAG